MHRFKVSGPNLVVRNKAILNEHSRLHQNLRLHLHLPGVGACEPGSVNHLQQRSRGRTRGQQLAILAVSRQAIAAFGCANNCSPRPDDLGRRRHTFDSLIEILIEWVSGVGRQYNVE